MFENMYNHSDINEFANSLSPLFKFKEYEEKKISTLDGKGVYLMTYSAITDDGDWSLEVSFACRIHHPYKKNYTPIVKIKPMFTYSPSNMQDKQKDFSEFLQNQYKPDYNPIMHISNTFIEVGVNSGLVVSADHEKCEQNLGMYCDVGKYQNHLKFESKNLIMINFYNILQKDNKDKTMSTKKSMITLEVVFLVDEDNKIKPYFKVKLPYSAQKKIIGIIPMNNAEVMYYTTNEDSLRTKCLPSFNKVSLTNGELKLLFENQFKSEAEKIISTKLNMEDMNFNELTIDELKEYFPLVEMVKI